MVSLLATYRAFKAYFWRFYLKEVEVVNDFAVGDYMTVYTFSECVLLRRSYTEEAFRKSRITTQAKRRLKPSIG